MNKVECIIRPEKLKDVTDALKKSGIGGMTVSEVRGFGVQSERPDSFLFVHKTKIEIYATDSQTKNIIPAILMYCSAGKAGDGKIAVIPLHDCVRVSTGERKNKAITCPKGRK
ncbi:MAG: P-II family nitrogen regulator [Candidatus Omnitrophica bacterium]|nr:P-II family nitrogen regulator [Candidatus Omnitrophota bacterium]MDD5552875.1 P-II family nitrogen regulator [Candidatus Omnitrophota bacterium]